VGALLEIIIKIDKFATAQPKVATGKTSTPFYLVIILVRATLPLGGTVCMKNNKFNKASS